MPLDDVWRVSDAYRATYDERVSCGEEEAAKRSLAVVSICRTAMPHLEKTMALVESLASKWRSASWYIYENDSADNTAAILDEFAASRPWVDVEHETVGEEDLRGFQASRTHRLARHRSRCQRWVLENAPDADYVVVLDTDPHGGFVVDGVLNSLGWMCHLHGEVCNRKAGAMASHSFFVRREGEGKFGIAAYDAWAARLSWFEDLGHYVWFHTLLPPIGSRPIPMNSAFGGLCLYTADAYLSGVYAGGDCEHVSFHRAMQLAGHQLYLNPGSRYIAVLP